LVKFSPLWMSKQSIPPPPPSEFTVMEAIHEDDVT
jgi:hypothetical protein